MRAVRGMVGIYHNGRGPSIIGLIPFSPSHDDVYCPYSLFNADGDDLSTNSDFFLRLSQLYGD